MSSSGRREDKEWKYCIEWIIDEWAHPPSIITVQQSGYEVSVRSYFQHEASGGGKWCEFFTRFSSPCLAWVANCQIWTTEQQYQSKARGGVVSIGECCLQSFDQSELSSALCSFGERFAVGCILTDIIMLFASVEAWTCTQEWICNVRLCEPCNRVRWQMVRARMGGRGSSSFDGMGSTFLPVSANAVAQKYGGKVWRQEATLQLYFAHGLRASPARRPQIAENFGKRCSR